MNPSCSWYTGLCSFHGWTIVLALNTQYTQSLLSMSSYDKTSMNVEQTKDYTVMNCSVFTIYAKFPAFRKYNGIIMEQRLNIFIFFIPQHGSIKLVFLWIELCQNIWFFKKLLLSCWSEQQFLKMNISLTLR